MSGVKIDLDKFKHLRTEKGATTLQHPDGHTITLNHAKMHPDGLKQLQALATSEQTPDQATEAREQQPVKMADGGGVQETVPQLYNDQLENQQAANIQDPAAAQAEPEPETAESQKFGADGSAPAHIDPTAFNEAKKVKLASEAARNAANQAQVADNVQQNAMRQQLGLPLIPGLAQNEAAKPQLAGPADQPQAAQPASPQAVSDFNDPTQQMMAGYNQMATGEKQKAAATDALGKEQAGQIEQQISAEQTAQQAFANSYNNLNQEHQDFVNDLQNAHIDPEKYWDSHSKIASGIGMILAGFNPTGRPNAAIEMLNHNMERNMQAQMANLGTKKTLLEANMRQYGNMRDAMDMTRIMQNEMAAKQLQMTASKMSGKFAQAGMNVALGQLKQQNAQMLQTMGLRRAVTDLSSNGGGSMSDQAIQHTLGYMDAMGSPEAKPLRERYVPGFTLAANPISEANRAEIRDHQQVQNLLGQAIQLANKKGTAFNWQELQGGQTLLNELQSQIRTAEQQGVYKKSEAEMMTQTLGSNPAGFLARYNSDPQLKRMADIQNMKYQNLLSGLGMRPNTPQGLQQSQQPTQAYKASGFKPRK